MNSINRHQHRRLGHGAVGRPRMRRRVRFQPQAKFFKPRGMPMRDLEIIELTHEEAEALRLKNVIDLDQIECARRMKTSQSTFQRILASAHRKVSEGIIKGKAIKIVKKQ